MTPRHEQISGRGAIPCRNAAMCAHTRPYSRRRLRIRCDSRLHRDRLAADLFGRFLPTLHDLQPPSRAHPGRRFFRARARVIRDCPKIARFPVWFYRAIGGCWAPADRGLCGHRYRPAAGGWQIPDRWQHRRQRGQRGLQRLERWAARRQHRIPGLNRGLRADGVGQPFAHCQTTLRRVPPGQIPRRQVHRFDVDRCAFGHGLPPDCPAT
jgi:hypothetical protein